MSIHIIRSATLIRTPWKNGGGTTAEIAVHPEGAGFEAFGWRLSMADVSSDGPFSSFAGIDRTLAVLTGAGLMLEDAGSNVRLDAASPLLSFSGDRPIVGRLIDGPIRDFNVMTRRGAFSHTVRTIPAGPVERRPAPGSWIAFLAHPGPCTIMVGGHAFALEALDTALFHDESDAIGIDGPAVLVQIWRG